MSQAVNMKRRNFLKTASASLGLGAFVIPGSALGLDGATPPSDRITMGLIGCGSHGAGWNLDRMFKNKDQQVLAVCDVDSKHMKHAKGRVAQHYSRTLKSPYTCRATGDFRELINQKDIDAVCVVTPDHWHTIPALMALKAGKHVICEKPLTLTVQEGRILSDAAKASGKVFQTASENLSVENYARLVELVQAGVLGEIKNIKVLLPPGNRMGKKGNFHETAPPKELNYKMWQGQAPLAPYCPARVHYNWRWNLAYSGGVLTDWIHHLLALAMLATGTEKTGPVEVEGEGEFPDRKSVWNAAPKYNLKYKFANGMTMSIWDDVPGLKFEGTDGWLLCRGWRGPIKASDPKLLKVELAKEQRLKRIRTDGQGGEHMDFTDAIKEGRQAYWPAEVGHRVITVAHIGNIAMMLKRKLRWDPAKEQFLNDSKADAMLTREQREPWAIKNVDSWLNVG